MLIYYSLFCISRYTADHDGYKADVSYIENAVSDDTPRSHVYQVAPTASRPNKYFPHRPSPTQLSFERLSGGYELQKTISKPQHYPISPLHSFASTPRPFAVHSSPAPESAFVAQPPQHQHANYVDLQNVEIETYNTAPHHFTQHQHQLQQHKPQLISSNRIAFPTSPTLYNDIHVLPSPRPYPYATTAPFVGQVGSKSTSIVASPASYAAQYHPTSAVRPSGTVASPASLYYLASGYSSHPGYQPQLQQTLPRQQFYVATVPHHNGHARRNVDHPSVNPSPHSGQSLLVRPDQALYYKQKK